MGIARFLVMSFPVSLVAPDALKPLLPLIGSLAHPKTLFVGAPCADEGTVGLLPGQTGYAAKIETGHRLVPLVNFCRHRNRLVHALAGRAARGIGWSTLDDDFARHVRAHPAQSEAKAGAGTEQRGDA